jgi:peptide/nickel transport system permease protein
MRTPVVDEPRRGWDAITWIAVITVAVFVLLAVAAPAFSLRTAPIDVVRDRFLPPMHQDHSGALHLLGTDRLGRDVWSRLIEGARISLSVGILTMAVSLLIGSALGGLAAFAPSWLRAILLGLTDFALGVPRVVLLLLLAAVWEPSATQVVLVLGLTGWMPIARLVYAESRAQRGRAYVAGAIALGATTARVFTRHVLPHVAAPVLAAVTLGIGSAITLEAGLSFLGLGVQPPAASWGSLIASGRDTVVNAPWVGLAPGIALVLVVVSISLLADAMLDRSRPA